MRRPSRSAWVSIAALALLASSFLSPAFRSVYGFASGESAGAVVGQPNFTSTISPSTGLREPSNFAFDSQGNLWVADAENGRILEETGLGSGQTPGVGVVLGQYSLETGASSLTQTGIDNPSGMAFDSQGNLWVADTNNSRVLEFTAPFSDGEAASLVIGQADFTSDDMPPSAGGLSDPGAVAFDSHGDLWVTDSGDSRVVEYQPPFTDGMNASLVIGQPNMASFTNSTSQSGMNYPASLRFDQSGDLWVSDAGNNRVLEYEAPFATGMNASLVIGQPGFTSDSHSATQSGMFVPESMAFDSTGNLWITDSFNDRVLEYQAPFTDGMNASVVLGQLNFTSTSIATTRSGMYVPTEVAFDKAGDLWVADLYNNRILEFDPPFTSGAAASRVIGQSDFVSNLFGGQEGLYEPMSVAFDSHGDLWAVDRGNNRVVEFTSPVSTGMNASVAIGQPSLTLDKAGSGADGLSTPTNIAFDAQGDLWVSDTLNSRILEFTAPFTTGMNASLVIGQPSFATTAPTQGQRGLAYPSSIAFDAQGDLWVADTGNARVVEFVPPFTDGMAATLVLGQQTFDSSSPGTSATSLGEPTGLAFDSQGNLWVSDLYKNAVVAFGRPFSTGETSTTVLQGGLPTPVPTQSSFAFPYSIAFDREGDLWLSDAAYNRVLQFSAPVEPGEKPSLVIGQAGFTTGTAGTSQTGLFTPLGIALDPSGNLWVADFSNNRVMEFPAATLGSTTTTSSSLTTTTTTTTRSSSTSTTTPSSTSSTTTTKSSTSTQSSATTTTPSRSSSTSTTTTPTATSSSSSVPPAVTATSSSTTVSSTSASSSRSSSSTTTRTSSAPSNGTYYILAGVAVVIVVVIIGAALLRRSRQPWRY